MTRAEALTLSGRSEKWLRTHLCAWCDQDLYRALRHGCPAQGEKCTPANKNFTDGAIARRTLLADQREVKS